MKELKRTKPVASLYEPPGGLLIWIIVFIEFITFSAGIIVFLYQQQQLPGEFAAARATLNKTIGTVNTILLLTSGYFMALALEAVRQNNNKAAVRNMLFTLFFGMGFLALKSVEYSQKLQHGHVLGSQPFYTFYWLLTGFHFVHVLAGVVIISYMAWAVKNDRYSNNNYDDLAMAAVFWHMCDLIWLFLFPTIYLLPS